MKDIDQGEWVRLNSRVRRARKELDEAQEKWQKALENKRAFEKEFDI